MQVLSVSAKCAAVLTHPVTHLVTSCLCRTYCCHLAKLPLKVVTSLCFVLVLLLQHRPTELQAVRNAAAAANCLKQDASAA